MNTTKYISALKTVLVITVGFVAIHLVCGCMWALWIAVAIGLCGVISKFLALKIEFVWMQLARLLNLIIPNLLLTVVYFIILVPIAMLSRLFTKHDPLHKKYSPGSLFEKQDKNFNPPSFEKPW